MMKTSFLFILAVMCSFASAHDADVIRNRFLQDNISYKQFIDLGKANCLDTTPSKTITYISKNKQRESVFTNHFKTISSLHSILPYFFRAQTIQKSVSAYQKERIGKLIEEYRKRDEYFNIHRSPLLICSKIFSENEHTKKLYEQFIRNPENMIAYSDPQFLHTYGAYFDRPNRVYD